MATITSISPTTGGPSTRITITGTGLLNTTQVDINGVVLGQRANVSDTSVTVFTPYGLTAGTVNVQAPTGNVSGPTFTPTYSAVFRSIKISNPNVTYVSGAVLSPIVVTALDQYGIAFTGAVGSLTVSSLIAPRIVSGTLTVAAVSGVWTFSNLTVA